MMLDRTIAISKRIIFQILHDRRSIGLILGGPILIMSLLGFSLSNQDDTLNRVAPALIATFALFFTFLLTGMGFLRERTQGTLERFLLTPVGRGDVLFGYLLGFLPFAAIQSIVILVYSLLAFRLDYAGSLLDVAIVLVLLVVVAVNMGIFISMFAKSEFQIAQFIPVVLGPQVFLSGIIVPIEHMPDYLQTVSRIMPLRYGVSGLQGIMLRGNTIMGVVEEVAFLVGFAVIFLILAGFTIRRG